MEKFDKYTTYLLHTLSVRKGRLDTFPDTLSLRHHRS